MKKTLLISALLYNTILFADTFNDFQKQQTKNYSDYKKINEEKFTAYKQAYNDAFKEFSIEINEKWPQITNTIDMTTKNKFVQYSEDLNTKQVINYEKKTISLEVIAKTEEEARKRIESMFVDLVNEDVEEAAKKDILENKIAKKLNTTREPVKSKQKLISDIITTQEKIKIQEELKNKNLIVIEHEGKFIYKANVKMPTDSTIRKAKLFKEDVLKNANIQQVPASLIYAIIHSESSFNPMARSHIPAFGLMQIVPKSAGIDSYQYLYNEKKVLSSNYLYNSRQNITIGSAYLHILYYRYLKKIEDPQSRLYCSIAAYNTGAGNVARTFIGNANINLASLMINKMSSEEVYKKLISSLPYNETRIYLKKVNDRVSAYNTLLKTTL